MLRLADRVLENLGWIAAVLAVAVVSSVVVFVPEAQAERRHGPVAAVSAQSQIFNDDLDVARGQVIQGDVVVYNGDVTVEEGGRVGGNLTLYSGDVEIKSGGVVGGDITSLSGDVQVEGRVDGSISSVSGDVELGDSAVVTGDISVVSGQIDQAAGARVGGSILRGTHLKIPLPPLLSGAPAFPQMPGVAPESPLLAMRPLSFMDRALGFMGRVLLALLLLAGAAAVAAAVATLRPQWVIDARGTLEKQMALSFAVGLLVNILLLAFIGLLYITVCLRPPALLLGTGLLGLNLVGWAATGNIIGSRLTTRMGERRTPAMRTGLGVLLPGAAVAFLWVLGGCFSFFAFLIAILLSAFGTGAVLVKTLKLMPPVSSTTGSGALPLTPVSTTSEPAVPVSPAAQASSDHAVESPADGILPAQEPVEATPISPPASPTEDVYPLSEGPAGAVGAQDDFTQIPGIGPKLSQRLVDAGVRTFSDLAGKTPEELSAILGWSVERVARGQVIEAAQAKAAR